MIKNQNIKKLLKKRVFNSKITLCLFANCIYSIWDSSSLPCRQFRKLTAIKLELVRRSLPCRQFRKIIITSGYRCPGSLPCRQFRKSGGVVVGHGRGSLPCRQFRNQANIDTKILHCSLPCRQFRNAPQRDKCQTLPFTTVQVVQKINNYSTRFNPTFTTLQV